jgi:hypothetical protein
MEGLPGAQCVQGRHVAVGKVPSDGSLEQRDCAGYRWADADGGDVGTKAHVGVSRLKAERRELTKPVINYLFCFKKLNV